MNPLDDLEPRESTSENARPRSPISRRLFLKGSGAAVASSAAAATVATAATIGVAGHTSAQDATPMASPMAGMGGSSLAPGDTPVAFFSMHEAATVDAIVSRIMPGSADDPGAHEAGVVDYIDRQLAGANLGYDLKTYTQGPFLVVSDQQTPVEQSSARDIYVSTPVSTNLVSRYGYQSVMTPQQLYRRGIAFVDAYAQSQHQLSFIELSTDQQDQILADMAADKATGFDGPTGKGFFSQLRNDTIEGMFSDPMYGGNRNYAGWNLIGYPGAQSYYSADELKNGTDKKPQSLMEMMASQASS